MIRIALLVALSSCVGACGDDGRRPEDGPQPDGGPEVGDAAPPLDAFADAAPDAPVVGGVVRYEHRPISTGGLGPAVFVPWSGVEVTLLEGAEPIATTTTDDSGSFGFEVSGTDVLVTASGLGDAVDVRDFASNVYAWEVPVEAGVANLAIDQARSSGAAAILVTLRDGLRYARDAFERAEPFPGPATHWERGRQTPYGSSYLLGDELWILGGPRDTDEFDTPVLLHELGHFIALVYEVADPTDGDPHAGVLTDPRLAWSEGWATFFSSAARGDGFYGDTIGDSLFYDLDLAALPTSGEYVARPSEPMSQSLSEWTIAASLFELYLSGDEVTQRARSFEVVRDWLSPRRSDRGLPGIDYVDFLDGYLCLNPEDSAALRSIAIERRMFPHDGDPACTKPFARRLGVAAPSLPTEPLPGRLWWDAERGRSLRIISLVQPPPGSPPSRSATTSHGH